jgi:hypothetical protein
MCCWNRFLVYAVVVVAVSLLLAASPLAAESARLRFHHSMNEQPMTMHF